MLQMTHLTGWEQRITNARYVQITRAEQMHALWNANEDRYISVKGFDIFSFPLLPHQKENIGNSGDLQIAQGQPPSGQLRTTVKELVSALKFPVRKASNM